MTRDSPKEIFLQQSGDGKANERHEHQYPHTSDGDFFVFLRGGQYLRQLYLSEKPTSPEPPCGEAEDAAWLTSIGSGVLKFAAVPQPMQNSAPSALCAAGRTHVGALACVFAPQPEQKAAPSDSLLPQLGQNLSVSLLAR
jgi:hypothetical protein